MQPLLFIVVAVVFWLLLSVKVRGRPQHLQEASCQPPRSSWTGWA